MNNYDDFTQPPSNDKKGLAIAAFVLGIVAIGFNPCFICSVVAIVLGVMSMNSWNSEASTFAKIGLGLGIATIVEHCIMDMLFGFTTCFC